MYYQVIYSLTICAFEIPVMQGSIASRTLGSIGVVACASRQRGLMTGSTFVDSVRTPVRLTTLIHVTARFFDDFAANILINCNENEITKRLQMSAIYVIFFTSHSNQFQLRCWQQCQIFSPNLIELVRKYEKLQRSNNLIREKLNEKLFLFSNDHQGLCNHKIFN